MPDSMLDLDDAVRAIVADTRSTSRRETVQSGSAAGRYLAGSIDAPISLPPFAASAMDGYAVRAAELAGDPPYSLIVAGTCYAGHPYPAHTAPGSCVRIFTGAPLPVDLDTVVIQENCNRDGDRVIMRSAVNTGDHVRPAGHDVAAGTRLFDDGRRLSAFDVGWLAACGIGRVSVHGRPVVGMFSTGDELLDAGAQPAPGQIFDANRVTVHTLLGELPVDVVDFGIVRDDPARIAEVLERADAECDMVLTSGGVSVGEADWVKDVVSSIGTLQIWKLNLKPGKPVAYGRLRNAAFFGLPGNPVSAIVTTLMLVRPAVEKLCGGTPRSPLAVPATLRGTLGHQPGREEFQRGTLALAGGRLEVRVTGDQSSNRLASFAAANCLIRVTRECGDLVDGATVATLPFRGAW